MEGRVRIMEQSHLNHMSSEPESPAVFGCRACLHVFTVDKYHNPPPVSGYNNCVGCGEGGLMYLGALPRVMEEKDKFYLIGADDEDTHLTGPYSTTEEAQADIWHWFNRKEEHAEEVTETRRKGHLRLAAIEGVILKEEGDSQDHQEGCRQEGCAKEST